MPLWTRKTITPGDRVTVEIQHSDRRALRPLIGLLRTVEVIDGARAIIFNEDGTRYAVNGKTLPPVALVEVSIFPDPATGGLWAHVYDLPPREHGPYRMDPRYAPVAQSDSKGGIARMPSCWCGKGCVCSTCGEHTIEIPTTSRLYWSTQSLTGNKHSHKCAPSSCTSTGPPDPSDLPYCCAMPMMLAPVAWVCRRESGHQRPYQWPNQTTNNK